MRIRNLPPWRTLLAAALVMAAAGPPALVAQKVGTAAVEPPGGGTTDMLHPGVSFSPAARTYYGSTQTIRIDYCDDVSLDRYNRVVRLNGVDLTVAYTASTKSGCGAYGYSNVTVNLSLGSNTLFSSIGDASGKVGSSSIAYTYAAADVTPPKSSAISPANGYAGGSTTLTSTADWCDEANLKASSASATVNGTAVPVTFTPLTPTAACPGRGRTSASVTLLAGDNQLVVTLADSAGNPGTATATYTYQPSVSAYPTNGDLRRPGQFDVQLSYSTPEYVSRGETRSLQMMYSSAQASPYGMVEIDVQDNLSDPADTTTLRLLRSDGVTYETLRVIAAGTDTTRVGTTEVFYLTGGGTNRLAAWFDAATLPTGAYTYTAVINRRWNGAVRTPETLTVPVRVLIANERSSAFGAGWTLAGNQRLTYQSDGVVLAEGDGTIRFFAKASCDASNRCTYTPPAGDFTTLTTWPDSAARVYKDGTRASFLANGRLRHVRDRRGQTMTFAYFEPACPQTWCVPGELSAVIDPAGVPVYLGYDKAAGLVTLFNVNNVASTHLSYTGRNLYTASAADSITGLRVSYDGRHRATQFAGRDGLNTDITYDGWGGMALMVGPSFAAQGGTWRDTARVVAYNRALLPAAGLGTAAAPATRVDLAAARGMLIGMRGDTTRVRLDRWGLAVEMRDPQGHTAQWSRDRHGRLTGESDGRGTSTGYSYDPAQAEVTTVKEHDLVVMNFNRNSFGQVTREWGNTQERNYWYSPADGVLDSMSVAGQGVTRFTYDALRRLRTQTDGAGHTTTWVYQDTALQNVETVTEEGNRITRFRYDTRGRPVQVTTPDNDVRSTSFDGIGRVRREVSAVGRDTVLYSYGPVFLNEVRDARGLVTAWRRNVRGWTTSEKRPGDAAGDSLVTEYDRYGRVARAWDRRRNSVSFTYDRWDRVLTRATSDGDTATFAYSPIVPNDTTAPIWVAARNAESVDTLRYDHRGRLKEAVTVRLTTTGWRRYVVQPAVDTYGLPVKVVVEGTGLARDSVRYSWNVHTGRLTEMFSWGGARTVFLYDAEGKLARTAYARDSLVYGYTDSHQLSSMYSARSAGLNAAAAFQLRFDTRNRLSERYPHSSARRRVFAYDSAGRLRGFTDQSEQGTSKPTCTFDPDYGQVCQEGTQYWTVTGSRTYTYDRSGNPADSGAVAQPGNRLQQWRGMAMLYDADGNLTQKTLPATRASGPFGYSWNALGLLTEVRDFTVSTAPKYTRHGYDAFGRRVRTTYPDGRVERVVYNGQDRQMDLDAAGAVTARYSFDPRGIDRPHSVTRGTRTLFYAQDPQGNVLALFDSAGAVAGSYSYDPWGRIESAVDTVPNPFRYTGREYDPGTGLYYYRARWYDPDLRRFVSEDPVGVRGGLNLYGYGANDPVNNVDPLGSTCYKVYGRVRTVLTVITYDGNTVIDVQDYPGEWRIDWATWQWAGDCRDRSNYDHAFRNTTQFEWEIRGRDDSDTRNGLPKGAWAKAMQCIGVAEGNFEQQALMARYRYEDGLHNAALPGFRARDWYEATQMDRLASAVGTAGTTMYDVNGCLGDAPGNFILLVTGLKAAAKGIQYLRPLLAP